MNPFSVSSFSVIEKQVCHTEQALTTIVICHDNDNKAYNLARHLPLSIYKKGIPVLVNRSNNVQAFDICNSNHLHYYIKCFGSKLIGCEMEKRMEMLDQLTWCYLDCTKEDGEKERSNISFNEQNILGSIMDNMYGILMSMKIEIVNELENKFDVELFYTISIVFFWHIILYPIIQLKRALKWKIL